MLTITSLQLAKYVYALVPLPYITPLSKKICPRFRTQRHYHYIELGVYELLQDSALVCLEKCHHQLCK